MTARRAKTIVILQSGYLPWLGFFDQLSRSDVFVLFDDVQYTRRDWRNRNRILTAQGPVWLTVPVYQKGQYSQLILETRINNEFPWARKHLETIRHSYARAPYVESYMGTLEDVLGRRWEFLVDLNLELIHLLAEALGLKRTIMRSSELHCEGSKTERLVNICKALGATVYLSGDAAENYIEVEKFEEANIRLNFHRYKHPVYPQLYDGFVPYLSVIDLLFNQGPRSLEILTHEGDPACTEVRPELHE